MIARTPFLSVVMPVYNGHNVLPKALEALAASDLRREFWELILVDDASTDDTVSIASAYADTIVRLGMYPHGPSYARNRGVEVARGDVLVFVDADVCVHRDTLRRFAWVFAEETDVAAVFGSYDNAPAAPGLVSQYRNLLHHYVHHQNRGTAETFWAGCGAIRRAAFLDVGMYNEWNFSRPQVEDIELGHRLRDHGYRIVLRPEIQGKHLKRWTLKGVVATDLKDRGVPWTRLLIQRGEAIASQTLNLQLKERVCTALSWLALLFGLTGALLREPSLALVAAAMVLVTLGLNLPLYRFFQRTGGAWFAIGVIPLHFLHYVLNGVSVLVAFAIHHLVGEAKPSPVVQAFAERGVIKWPPVPQQVDAAAGGIRAGRHP